MVEAESTHTESETMPDIPQENTGYQEKRNDSCFGLQAKIRMLKCLNKGEGK